MAVKETTIYEGGRGGGVGECERVEPVRTMMFSHVSVALCLSIVSERNICITPKDKKLNIC
jgi:hypothetical protein